MLRDPHILERTMTRDELRVLREFPRKVRVRFRDRLDDIIVFGSRARGDAHAESDIDVLVLLRVTPEGAR
jgi:predicted nucleotidyltransferase